jgi:AbrB family looped-hinge helix DNA binding protein
VLCVHIVLYISLWYKYYMNVQQNRKYTDYESSVSPKGQITLPVQARHKFKVAPRDRVIIRLYEDGEIVIVPPLASIQDFYQAVPPLATPLPDEEMREIAQEDVAHAWREQNV